MSLEFIGSPQAYWAVNNGYFSPFDIDYNQISEEGLIFIQNVERLPFQDPLFVRGSLIESQNPFHLSDVDIIVIHSQEDRHQAAHKLQRLTHRTLDIKWLSREEFDRDLTQRALATHRSIQIAGPRLILSPIPTDFDFIWEHWCTYFPMGLPKKLHSEDPFGLIFMKHVIRCFGVLSFMENPKCFTRDIDQCLHIAAYYDSNMSQKLQKFRRSLELGHKDSLDITDVIQFLILEFDT